MAKKNLSRDQKRKAKLKKRAERSRPQESLAYSGNKYRTAELVPVMLRTEVGIYESYVMLDPDLTDNDVQSAIERMIIQLRDGTLSPLPDPEDPDEDEVDAEDFIRERIRRNWQVYSETKALPPKDDLIGILRTILNSLDIWRWKEMSPQGYYKFLKGFMKDAGVTIHRLESDTLTRERPAVGELPAPEGRGTA
ncbi:hypothetical protein [Aquisphaera insulae]|uniref:hypothetical protein n=1 Tax=Aquisphaera insulae TaxID=2712864 RepID=UPI00196B3299|nr:hypothetical protein [Aquisphaera insulae]